MALSRRDPTGSSRREVPKKCNQLHSSTSPSQPTDADRIQLIELRICPQSHIGISPTEGIRIFYKQIMLRDGLPFAVAVPNDCTATTLEKSRRGEEVQAFVSLDAMFENWKK